jgi:hypothetical protein
MSHDLVGAYGMYVCSAAEFWISVVFNGVCGVCRRSDGVSEFCKITTCTAASDIVPSRMELLIRSSTPAVMTCEGARACGCVPR